VKRPMRMITKFENEKFGMEGNENSLHGNGRE